MDRRPTVNAGASFAVSVPVASLGVSRLWAFSVFSPLRGDPLPPIKNPENKANKSLRINKSMAKRAKNKAKTKPNPEN